MDGSVVKIYSDAPIQVLTTFSKGKKERGSLIRKGEITWRRG
jgi:hypothetical protein